MNSTQNIQNGDSWLVRTDTGRKVHMALVMGGRGITHGLNGKFATEYLRKLEDDSVLTDALKAEGIHADHLCKTCFYTKTRMAYAKM